MKAIFFFQVGITLSLMPVPDTWKIKDKTSLLNTLEINFNKWTRHEIKLWDISKDNI